jgi:hypothetical protein
VCPTCRALSHALPPPWQAHEHSKHSRGDLHTTLLPPSRGTSRTLSAALCWGRKQGVSANLGEFVTMPFTRFRTPQGCVLSAEGALNPAVSARSGTSMAASRVVTSQPDAQCGH